MVYLVISVEFLLSKAENTLKKVSAIAALKMDLVLEVLLATVANLRSDGRSYRHYNNE